MAEALEQATLLEQACPRVGVVEPLGPKRLDDAASAAPSVPRVVHVEPAPTAQVGDQLIAGRDQRPGRERGLLHRPTPSASSAFCSAHRRA
jgi:hypothetical protein